MLARAVGLQHGPPDGGEEVGGDGVDQFEVERPLGGEVLVEQGLGDSGGLGDVVHGRGAVAALGEELQRDGEELVPSLFGREPP